MECEMCVTLHPSSGDRAMWLVHTKVSLLDGVLYNVCDDHLLNVIGEACVGYDVGDPHTQFIVEAL